LIRFPDDFAEYVTRCSLLRIAKLEDLAANVSP
jgi:hypothetical protein